MNPLRNACLLVVMFALACANRGPRPETHMHDDRNSIKNSWKPSDWLPAHELESLPSFNEMTFKKLEQMPVREGAMLLNKMYHLAQVKTDFEPNFTPQLSEITVHWYTPNNQKTSMKLNEVTKIAREQPDMGHQEMTIFITGLPQEMESVQKATRKLVEAYMQRYRSNRMQSPTSSEEDKNMSLSDRNSESSGHLMVIDLGSAIPSFKAYATMDVEETGAKIAEALEKMTEKANISPDTVHVIGSNMGAHVAGAAGRHFARQTGQQWHRITGLDPSKLYARKSNTMSGLARGDAKFVDAIHTSAYGMGAPTRSADADFYPNGPDAGAPGTDNVVEASMRAVRYYAESVLPGNERNFPAVGAISLSEYKDHNGYGKRVYMGMNTDHDVQGDFVLQVNAKSPFGRREPAMKQKNQNSMHKSWKMHSQDN